MFERNNEQRKYVGLDPILPHWDRVLLAGDKHRPESILYFDGDVIKRQIISTKEEYIEKSTRKQPAIARLCYLKQKRQRST